MELETIKSKVLWNLILLELITEERVRDSGLVIVGADKVLVDKGGNVKSSTPEAIKVVAVGPDCKEVKVGDYVLIAPGRVKNCRLRKTTEKLDPLSGNKTSIHKDYMVTSEYDIWMILNDETIELMIPTEQGMQQLD